MNTDLLRTQFETWALATPPDMLTNWEVFQAGAAALAAQPAQEAVAPCPFDAVKLFANSVLKMLDERIEVAARNAHPFMDKFGDHPETIVAAKAQASELREVRNQVRILGDRALVELMKFKPASQAPTAAQPVVKYVPVDSKLRDGNWNHPNDDEARTPACIDALNARGDDKGQGLDGYWKWGFAAGFNAALAAAPQPAPAAAPTQEVERVTPEQLQALKRGLHTGKIIPPAAPAPAAGDELTHAELDGGDLPCPRCNGSGFDIVMSDNGPDAYETEVNCDHCDGRGSLGAAYTHLAQTLKRERERNKAAGNELHWHKSGPFWGYRADKSIQTVADRLDELADACSKYDARSERASDLRAAATIWRKHLAGPAEEQSPGGEDAA